MKIAIALKKFLLLIIVGSLIGFSRSADSQTILEEFEQQTISAQFVPPRKSVLNLLHRVARNGQYEGTHRGRLAVLIDFELPSTVKRLWVIDLDSNQVVFNDWSAHGKNSGENLTVSFSNKLGSNQSSLGVFLTGSRYFGKNGLSLRLEGLEPGFNDNALARAIVIHGADYVSQFFIDTYGRLGRSLGCPAVSTSNIEKLTDLIEEGSLVFAYYPDPTYLRDSLFLK